MFSFVVVVVFFAPGPPVILVPPRSASLNVSQNADLTCKSIADPPNMTYVWMKGRENVHHIE